MASDRHPEHGKDSVDQDKKPDGTTQHVTAEQGKIIIAKNLKPILLCGTTIPSLTGDLEQHLTIRANKWHRFQALKSSMGAVGPLLSVCLITLHTLTDVALIRKCTPSKNPPRPVPQIMSYLVPVMVLYYCKLSTTASRRLSFSRL